MLKIYQNCPICPEKLVLQCRKTLLQNEIEFICGKLNYIQRVNTDLEEVLWDYFRTKEFMVNNIKDNVSVYDLLSIKYLFQLQNVNLEPNPQINDRIKNILVLL